MNQKSLKIENWAGNQQWWPEKLLFPSSESELKDQVFAAIKKGKGIRIIGAAHSFTSLCNSEQVNISLDKLQGVDLRNESIYANVQAGTIIKYLGELLADKGLAQENLGDINVQSLAGAISTGTHGTGLRLGNISTQAEAITFINGKGEVITTSRTHNVDLFRAVSVSLGSLGVITSVKLRCMPAYNLKLELRKQHLDDVLGGLGDILSQNRHFEFYMIPGRDFVQARYGNIVDQQARYSSAFKTYINDVLLENYALELLCLINKLLPRSSSLISKLIELAISNETKVHQSHKVFSTVRKVKFVEMEYNVPLEAYASVMKELRKMLNDRRYNISFPIEHRFVQADDLMLSPAYKRDSAYIACHVYKGMDYQRYFRELEALFIAHEGRPHWGKMHAQTSRYFQKVYPEFDNFLRIRAENDPDGIFLNSHLKGVFGIE
jgi:FAD-linked oxidoreductase